MPRLCGCFFAIEDITSPGFRLLLQDQNTGTISVIYPPLKWQLSWPSQLLSTKTVKACLMRLELQMLGLKSRLYDKMLRKLSRKWNGTKNQEPRNQWNGLLDRIPSGFDSKGSRGLMKFPGSRYFKFCSSWVLSLITAHLKIR